LIESKADTITDTRFLEFASVCPARVVSGWGDEWLIDVSRPKESGEFKTVFSLNWRLVFLTGGKHFNLP
jgi:hypothetical protein